MHRFEKSKAPRPLRVWIQQNQPLTAQIWKDLPGELKDVLRACMHRDQRGLCCYCYTRVANDHTDHIEHVAPQSNENRFEWENLALSCEGGNHSGNPKHCDHAKSDKPLQVIHPYKNPVIQFVTLRSTGALRVDEPAQPDVERVLNLNARHLQRLRKSALDAALADLARGKRRHTRWSPRSLQQTLDELQRRSELLDYQPLIEGWLERRLRQLP